MEQLAEPRGTRWALGLEYDGNGFCGWQRQLDQDSVQGV
ncbi:tRNA pseudouridine(38-40) synthase TruA, partial [Acidithiobacillus ferridurans]|nr:tRNA pseudouridine(38-40) synthase TruA [Acidithiobacillus ferridurans]